MILCCGEALIDMLPVSSSTGERCFVPKAGGSVFNTAISLGRLSSDVSLFAGISNDFFGKFLEEELSNSKVSLECLVRSNNPTSLAFVDFEGQEANYTFYSNNAADTMLTASDISDKILNFDFLFFGGISLCTEPTATTMLDLMCLTHKRSVIVLDPNIRAAFISDEKYFLERLVKMVMMADILKLSEVDLEWLVSKDIEQKNVFGALINNEKKLVILTKGKRGAEAFFGGKKIASVESISVKVEDTVGAGDSFNAGLIFFLKQHGVLSKTFLTSPSPEILFQALTFASKVAGLTVSKVGADSPWLLDL